MKLKNLRIKAISFILAFAAIFTFSGCEKNVSDDRTPLTVTLLKVGKADAIIALTDNKALVIDVGEEDDGPEVVKFLQKRNITEVEALIITHYDQDHVGGADTLLEQINVKNVYVPNYEGMHSEYYDFIKAAENAKVPLQKLDKNVSFKFGDAEVLIEPPLSYELKTSDTEKDTDNNFSLITTITHGNNRFVFAGDAEKRRIREWLESENAVKCDFLKVPHHGVYNGALDELLEQIKPEYAVICSSKKHPAESKALEVIKKYCKNVYETKDGNVMVLSDGNRMEIKQKLKK